MRLSIGLLLITAPNIWGQAIQQPGQLATAPTLRAFSAKSAIEAASPKRDRLLTRTWLGSVAAMVGATALDAGTSWGKREANGLLASENGTFGGKGLALKSGLAAGILVPQVLLRRHTEAKIAGILANFSQAAVFSAVSAHNLGVAGPK